MSEHTKKCNNCGKEISSAKFFLHEPFCIMHIVRCETCNEPVAKDELEEHQNDNHKLQDCRDCGKKLERRLLSSHKKKCLNSPAVCVYCELTMPKSELHDHEYVCGSKTEKCHLCGELVPKMEYDLHLDYNCKKTVKEDAVYTANEDEAVYTSKDDFMSRLNKKSNTSNIGKTERKRNNTGNSYTGNIKSNSNIDSHFENPNNNINISKKPLSKKQNFSDYMENLKKLQEESEKAIETVKYSAKELSNIDKESKKRNECSNNIQIKNRKIDEFIYEESKNSNLNSNLNNNFNNNVGKNMKKNNKENGKEKFIKPIKKGAGKKTSQIASNSYKEVVDNNDYNEDGDDDVLQAILEMSKRDK